MFAGLLSVYMFKIAVVQRGLLCLIYYVKLINDSRRCLFVCLLSRKIIIKKNTKMYSSRVGFSTNQMSDSYSPLKIMLNKITTRVHQSHIRSILINKASTRPGRGPSNISKLILRQKGNLNFAALPSPLQAKLGLRSIS